MGMFERIEKYEIKVYLENLRKSGKVNMFAAASYLANEFRMSDKEAVAALTEWIQNYDPTDYRVCQICGKAISVGFCVGDGLAYYCSEECLHTDYSEEEYQEMYETDNAYYTEWDE